MSLKDRLAREIALTGPMTVADYMTRCLHDPQGGYYATRPAIGATTNGDGSVWLPMRSAVASNSAGFVLSVTFAVYGKGMDGRA